MGALKELPSKGRFMALKKDGFVIATALNLIDHPSMMKILSQGVHEVEQYQNLKNDKGTTNLLSSLYEVFKED
jgi:hypothetical protein